MITTLTPNPALDKTARVERMKANALNRLFDVTVDAGGKGVNVSAMIKALGGESLTTGFVGGGAGDEFLSLVGKKGIEGDFVKVRGTTRTNLKVVDADGNLTELNEPGPDIAPAEWEEMTKKLVSRAKPGNWFSLSGSLPRGLGKDTYRKLCALLRKGGAKVFLDCDGESFRLALEAPPDEAPHYVKPNTHELLEYFGKDAGKTPPETELAEMCRELLGKGLELVVLSMGGDGAMFVSKDAAYRAPALKIEVKSSVGAGDSMIGALLHAFEKRLDPEDAYKLSMASSAGACATPGTNPPDKSAVEALLKETRLAKL
ncbi:MAG: 1-phosphofructokinase [Deltaproteobacteria bacterium]|jgi:1-phosphofructokinase|nr:1-phosphofructokinase [Deltaproteobacteria bacterium]